MPFRRSAAASFASARAGSEVNGDTRPCERRSPGFVPSLSHIRATVEAHGGVMNAADQEWDDSGWRVCDGLDPEGNVVQFRARPS